MLRTICEDFSFVLVKNRIISEEDRETYIYGLELMITSFLAFGTILLLGFIFNQIIITVTFLAIFCSIRQYSGGYHANQYWKCFCIICLLYLMLLILANMPLVSSNVLLTYVLLAVSFIGIFLMSPLNSVKNPKSEQDMRKNKILTRILVSTYTFIAAAGLILYPDVQRLWFTIAYTQLVVTILLMITILQRRYLA